MQQAEPRPSALQLRRLLQVYANGLRADPSDLVLRTKLAEVLRLLGRHDEAISLYSSVAWAHGVAGNLGQSIMICKLILELNPHHSATQEMLAKLYASKQIRDQKQSIPVVNVGGRWVADPRRPSSAVAVQPTPEASSVSSPVLTGASANSLQTFQPTSTAAIKDLGDEPKWARPPSAELALGPGLPEPPEPEFLPAPPPKTALEPQVDDMEDEEPEPDEIITSCELPRGARRRRAAGALPEPERRFEELEEGLRKLKASQPEVPSAAAAESLPPVRQPTYSPQLPSPDELPDFAKEPTKIEDTSEPRVQAPFSAKAQLVAPSASYVDALATTRPAPPSEEQLRASRERSVPAAEAAPPEPPPAEDILEANLIDSGPAEEDTEEDQEPPPIPQVASEELSLSPASDSTGPSVSLRHLIMSPDPAADAADALNTSQQASVGTGTGPAPRPSSTSRSSEALHPGRLSRATRLGFTAAVDTGSLPPPSSNLTDDAPALEPQPEPVEPLAQPAEVFAAESDCVRLAAGHESKKPTDRMDSALVNSLLRMDAEQAFLRRPAGRGYTSIQREVRVAGKEQAEHEIAPDQAAEAEQNLADTLRDTPNPMRAEGSVERYLVPFPLFSDLDTPAFLAVIRRLERRVFPTGTWIFREGDPGDSLYLVSSGVLQVLKEKDRDQPIQLARLGGGSFFGEFGLLTDGRRHASVRCMEEAELLELRREVLVQLCEEHPSITWTLRTFYQQRVMSMVLATSPIFQAVRPADRKSVLSRFGFRRFMPNETIIEQEKQGTGFYVILVGWARVSCKAEDGSDVDLGLLSEGNYFGEMSLLSGAGAEATVRAGTITEVLMLGPQDFYELSADHPEIWAVVQHEADRRRQDTARRLASLQPPAAGDLCLI